MAIDPEKFREFTGQLSQVAESSTMSDVFTIDVMDTVIETAISDMYNLVDESRPPRNSTRMEAVRAD